MKTLTQEFATVTINPDGKIEMKFPDKDKATEVANTNLAAALENNPHFQAAKKQEGRVLTFERSK